MEEIIKEIENAKNFQVEACFNHVSKMFNESSDNLTSHISREIKALLHKEMEKRGLPESLY